jgi:hypothetical protein
MHLVNYSAELPTENTALSNTLSLVANISYSCTLYCSKLLLAHAMFAVSGEQWRARTPSILNALPAPHLPNAATHSQLKRTLAHEFMDIIPSHRSRLLVPSARSAAYINAHTRLSPPSANQINKQAPKQEVLNSAERRRTHILIITLLASVADCSPALSPGRQWLSPSRSLFASSSLSSFA